LVRAAGFDPATSRFRAEGSTRLSYTLLNWRAKADEDRSPWSRTLGAYRTVAADPRGLAMSCSLWQNATS
jgi:hypothetical protein